ncbi:MAG: sugar ABC transporter permease [Acholeplasmataceae bacterium]|nr:sugar ABC transporter permease [Acholeplasmataceae bacterium]
MQNLQQINLSEKKAKPRRTLNRHAKKRIFIIVMLAYPLLQFILFWGYVNFDTILLTFKSFSWTTGNYTFVGFQNYRSVINDILNNESTKRMLFNSLLYMPINSFVILPLSLIFSYFLYKKIPLSGFFRVVYFLPSILPIVVLTMTFGFIFDSNLGPVNSILKSVFAIPTADIPSWFGSYPTSQIMILVYCVWAGLGFNILLLSGAIARIPTELIEYGELEGITLFQELKNVVIPLIWPTITTTFLLGCTAVFTVLLQPLLLTPDNPYTNTIALSIYNSVIRNGNMAYFATFGIVVSLIGTPIIMGIRRAMSKAYQDVDY